MVAQQPGGRVPQASTHFVDGGHYALFEHAGEIMAALGAG